MERSDIIRRMKSKTTTIDAFNYDALTAPPLLSLLSYDDIEYFRRLATSIKYSAKIDYKYSEIDRVMKSRGFVKLGGGTNRVVYRHLEIDTIVVKIAIDDVGMKDNPREYENQFYLKPYVTKVFEVSPCGTVGLFERCEQIKSREEFMSIATEVFDLLSNWIIGKYIMEDIGSTFFMNYCVREGFGPVLCDFPYLYELDGNKLFCQLPDDNGFTCGGVIDYDKGFNHLYCSKCGVRYKAIELKKAIENKIIIKEEKEIFKMNVVLKIGDKVVVGSNEGNQSRKYESRLQRGYNAIKANAYSNNIKVTTSYQKREEEAVTRMNELPEWDDVEREAEVVDVEVEEVNTLDYKYYADIEDICIATVDYIKNTVLKDEDVHVSITLDIADEDNSNDLLTKIFTDDDIPENYGESDDDVSEDKDQEESEDTNVDYDEPEDAYEESEGVDADVSEEDTTDWDHVPAEEVFETVSDTDEETTDDETITYSSSFIPNELPVGSTQVNSSYYDNNEKEK